MVKMASEGGDLMSETVVSAAIAGPDDEGGPDLRACMRLLLEVLDGLLTGGSTGIEGIGGWVLRWAGPGDDRSLDVAWPLADDRRLDACVSGLGEDFDRLLLKVGPVEVSVEWPEREVTRDHHSHLFRQVLVSVNTSGSAVVVAGALREWVRRCVAVLGRGSGFVHLDGLADPYGKLLVQRARLSSEDFSRMVHGYYWTVLLSPEHQARLGRQAESLVRSVCESVERIPSPSGEFLLCTLCDDPEELSEKRVREWRSTLGPLLRPGFLMTKWGPVEGSAAMAPGPPPEELSNARWLFEGPPLPDMLLAFIRDLPDGIEPLPIREFTEPEAWPDETSLVCHLYPGEDFRGGSDHDNSDLAGSDLLYVEAALRQLFEVTRAGLLKRPEEAIDDYTTPRMDFDLDMLPVVRFVLIGGMCPNPEIARTLAVLFAGVNTNLHRTAFSELAYQMPPDLP